LSHVDLHDDREEQLSGHFSLSPRGSADGRRRPRGSWVVVDNQEEKTKNTSKDLVGEKFFED
jgi:hypothetical protein